MKDYRLAINIRGVPQIMLKLSAQEKYKHFLSKCLQTIENIELKKKRLGPYFDILEALQEKELAEKICLYIEEIIGEENLREEEYYQLKLYDYLKSRCKFANNLEDLPLATAILSETLAKTNKIKNSKLHYKVLNKIIDCTERLTEAPGVWVPLKRTVNEVNKLFSEILEKEEEDEEEKFHSKYFGIYTRVVDLYMKSDRKKKAEKVLNYAEEIIKKIKEPVQKCISLCELSKGFAIMGNREKAKNYLAESKEIEVLELEKNFIKIIAVAESEHQLGNRKNTQELIAQARHSIDRSSEFASMHLQAIARALIRTDNTDSVLGVLQEALGLVSKIDEIYLSCTELLNISKLFLKIGRKEKSLKVLKSVANMVIKAKVAIEEKEEVLRTVLWDILEFDDLESLPSMLKRMRMAAKTIGSERLYYEGKAAEGKVYLIKQDFERTEKSLKEILKWSVLKAREEKPAVGEELPKEKEELHVTGIHFECPQCGKLLTYSMKYSGKKGMCSDCESLFTVP